MKENMVVIDASIAIKAILPNPLQGQCRTLVQTFVEVQPVAPALWVYETTSAITKAVHFEQLTNEEGCQALERVAALGVRLFVPDANQNQAAFDWTMRLMRASAYDSFYIVLAKALGCNFWTADSRLFNALKDAGVEWVHWIEEFKPMSI